MNQDKTTKFNQATASFANTAFKIDAAVSKAGIDVQYRLPDIVRTLRDLFKDHIFRDRFTGVNQFIDPVWSKGMCALTAKCVYELYGGEQVWDFNAIRMGAWEHGPVVFLRDKLLDLPFDPTGDQHPVTRVPYELGSPLNRKLTTPNSEDFIKIVKHKLDQRQ